MFDRKLNYCIYHGEQRTYIYEETAKPVVYSELNLGKPKTYTFIICGKYKNPWLFPEFNLLETGKNPVSYFEQRNSDINMKLFIWKLPNLQFDLEVSDSGLWTLDSWTLDSWTLDT